ncbi:hypothetical protein KUTeg_001745 [Tegillarca granosa]|uniref:Uncharacterized protein n=1 Tax=Tegillarca granosa TaxID=220873 RepID=A0ABQ9FWR2_TEGGR|nr:hypothetical protein KUTeg_001745 [Tegillarca granosa]
MNEPLLFRFHSNDDSNESFAVLYSSNICSLPLRTSNLPALLSFVCMLLITVPIKQRKIHRGSDAFNDNNPRIKFTNKTYKKDIFQLPWKDFSTCIGFGCGEDIADICISRILTKHALLLTTTMATNINRYRGLKCYDCERMMVYCVFRCSMQPTYVKWYYCADYCERRNLTCLNNCRRD